MDKSPRKKHIAAGTAVSIHLSNKQTVRIINPEGGQVVDTWAFSRENPSEHLSMEHSRSALYKLWFEPGDTLVSNSFNPMLTINNDTSPGMHDTLHAACSKASYRFYGEGDNHPNCQDNLINVLSEQGIDLQCIPCPWNLFEHALVNEKMKLSDLPASAKKGDYVELIAEQDLILVCSACPSLVGSISGERPAGALLEIIEQ